MPTPSKKKRPAARRKVAESPGDRNRKPTVALPPTAKKSGKVRRKTRRKADADADAFASCIEITSAGFRKALRQQLRSAKLDTGAMPAVAADTVYYLLTEPQMRELHREFGKMLKKWARSMKLAAVGYMPEVFDCDDYTWCFKAFASLRALKLNQETGRGTNRPAGFAIGVAWGVFPGEGAHAVWFFDPQSGKATPASDVESLSLIVA